MNEKYKFVIFDENTYLIEINGIQYEYYGKDIANLIKEFILCPHEYTEASHVVCDCGELHIYCQDCGDQMEEC